MQVLATPRSGKGSPAYVTQGERAGGSTAVMVGSGVALWVCAWVLTGPQEESVGQGKGLVSLQKKLVGLGGFAQARSGSWRTKNDLVGI